MSGTQYIVDNSSILSSSIKYVGSLAASTLYTTPSEVVSQFGSGILSIELGNLATISFAVLATNDVSSEVWTQVAIFTPTQTITTYAINMAYRKIKVQIQSGATPLTGINFLMFYSTASSSTGPTLRAINDNVTNQDMMALGRNVIMGRGKLLTSSIQNTTVASDYSLKVTKGNKLYALDEQEKLSQQVKLQMYSGIDQGYIANAGTISYTGNQLVLGANGATDISEVKSSGGLKCSNDSALVFRGAANFSSGTAAGSVSGLFFGDHRIGLGTSGLTGFGLFIDTTGAYPLVSLTIVGPISTSGNITVTLGGVVYTMTSVSANPDRPEDTARAITIAFNLLGAPWYASQAGPVIYFTSIEPIAAGAVAVNFGTTGAIGTIVATVAGAAPTITFIDRTTFNCDQMTGTQGLPAWTSGDYVEFEISVFGNGRNYKLAIVDKNTQDLVDVQVGSLTRKFATSSSQPVVARCVGSGSSMTVSNAILYNIQDQRGYPIISRGTIPMDYVYSLAGDFVCPIGVLSKNTLNGPNAVVKKLVIMNNGPNRTYINISVNSTMGGEQFVLTGSSSDAYVTAAYTVAEQTSASLASYVAGRTIYSDNVAGNVELDLNLPLEAGFPWTISMASGSYVPGHFDMAFIIEYFN